MIYNRKVTIVKNVNFVHKSCSVNIIVMPRQVFHCQTTRKNVLPIQRRQVLGGVFNSGGGGELVAPPAPGSDCKLFKKKSCPLKIVLVGDPGSGKTKLVKQYVEGTFTSDPEDDLADLHHSTEEPTGKKIPIIIYDAPAGLSEVNTHRNTYFNADAIIFCFDLCNKKSLRSLQGKWIPELKSANCVRSYQFILVGTKEDDRERTMRHESRRGKEGKTVSYKEGFAVHDDIESCAYFECSAKTGKGVKNIFRVASLIAFSQRKSRARFIQWNTDKSLRDLGRGQENQTSL